LAGWQAIAAFWIALVFMLVGLFGLIIPVFPGMLIIWLSALGYGLLAKGFDTLGIVLFALITICTIAGMLADNVLMGAGARRGGASWLTILVALACGVIFTFVFPPIGGLIAAPLSVLLLEYLRLGDLEKAWRATRGLVFGWGLSFLVRFGIGLVMIALWLVWAFSNAP
jgi:hypothetical protein